MTQCQRQIEGGERFDFVVFVDDSCGFEDTECAAMLDGAGAVILSLLNYPYSRVKLLQFGGGGGVDVLVDLDDELQLNAIEYVKYIRKHGQCQDTGTGNTELFAALRSEGKRVDKGRSTKFVVISGCRDENKKLCRLWQELDRAHIDLYAVNVPGNGRMNRQDAGEYLVCLADDDPDRVCVAGQALDGEGNGFDGVISDCLLPQICAVGQREVWVNGVKAVRGFGDD